MNSAGGPAVPMPTGPTAAGPTAAEPTAAEPMTADAPCRHPGIGDDQPHAWPEHVARVISLRHSDPERCVEVAAATIAGAREHGEAAAEMEMSYYLGFALHLLGRNAESYSANDTTLKIARALGDTGWEGRALMGLGTVFAAIGDFATAIDYYDRSLTIRRAIGDRAGEAAVLNNLGEIYRGMGGFETRAVTLYREASGLFASLGTTDSICITNVALAEFARYERLRDADPQAAREAAEAAHRAACEAVAAADESGERRMAVGARLVLAEALSALGRTDEARRSVQEAKHLRGRYADTQLEINYRTTLARLLCTEGRHSVAIEVLRDALAASERVERPMERLKVLRELEGALEAVGDLRGALDTLREFHRVSLRLRDQETERRAHVVQVQLDIERARHLAEMERLRSARLEQQNRLLSRLAQEDDLTGLLNRRALESLLQARFEPGDDAARPLGFVCVLADLDHFKQVNDLLSHQVGDEVLRRVGTIIRETLRGEDVAARYGGEEFALLIGGGDLDAAAAVCERLRRAVETHAWPGVRGGLAVSVSLGATAARPDDTVDSLLARADALLYLAKKRGRNRIETG